MIKSGLNSFPRPKYAPSVAVPGANSIILMHFDGVNGSTTFTDVYGTVAPTATGTAAISTTQSVFGGASIHCPSGTNYITGTATSTKLNIGTGDFTVEFRNYLDASPSGFQSSVALHTGNTVGAIVVGVNSSNKVWCYVANNAGFGATYTSTGTVSNTAWHAIAAARKAGTIYLFIDGTLDSSQADTTNVGNMSGVVFWVGNESGGSAASGNGFYVDELRISNAGLYTATYTPASSAFTA